MRAACQLAAWGSIYNLQFQAVRIWLLTTICSENKFNSEYETKMQIINLHQFINKKFQHLKWTAHEMSMYRTARAKLQDAKKYPIMPVAFSSKVTYYVYSFQMQGNTLLQQKVDFTTQVPQVVFQFVIHLHRFCINTLRTNLRSYADIRSNKNTQRSIYCFWRKFRKCVTLLEASTVTLLEDIIMHLLLISKHL